MAWNTNVLVGQSGGPTAAINASLAGVFDTARDLGAHVLGMRYGIEGFLSGRILHLDRTLGDPMDIELLRRTPSSFLGSCRFKLPQVDEDPAFYEDAFRKFEESRVGAVLYIGGNDSMDTIDKLSQWGARVGSDIRFIGIPKTIDNDLVGTDHTPGYGSALRRGLAEARGEVVVFADADTTYDFAHLDPLTIDLGHVVPPPAVIDISVFIKAHQVAGHIHFPARVERTWPKLLRCFLRPVQIPQCQCIIDNGKLANLSGLGNACSVLIQQIKLRSRHGFAQEIPGILLRSDPAGHGRRFG